MQAKSIRADLGEVRKVSNEWAAQVEQRGTTVSSSSWEATPGLTLGATTLVGTTTTALVTVADSGVVTNTVTLANGETLEVWREIIV